MKRSLFLSLMVIAFQGILACSQAKEYPYRFVYVHGKPLENTDQVELIRELAKTASEHGLNGLILDAFFDRLPREAPYNYKNLKEIHRICQQNNLELIPSFMGVGYNAPLQSYDKNLMEGLPIKDALFVVKGSKAELVADPPVNIANGGFEQSEGEKPANFSITDQPGAKISLDREIFKQGSSSLRVEISKEYEEGSALQIRIRSDRSAPYKFVEPIMLACVQAGIWDVSFSVYRPEDVR